MIKLLQAGAVPFGYTTDMSDSDFPYYSGDCVNALEISWRHNHYLDADDFRLLPDVITSHTPPPSPLRRSHSCLIFSHEKTQPQTSLASPASSSIQQGTSAEVEVRPRHIHKMRRQVQSDASTTSHLPHLSWVLSRLPSPSQHRSANFGDQGRWRGREGDEAEERRRLWQHIGGDLRKMADQFQENKSSVSKGSADDTRSLTAILSRCVAGSLLCLVWWRLYHSSH